jgi:hypothetical protein
VLEPAATSQVNELVHDGESQGSASRDYSKHEGKPVDVIVREGVLLER